MDGVESSEELHFFYDAQSRPAMVEYNGDMYSYLHNLQGDIIGIVDAEGNLVVEYKYDAWGKPIYEAGSLLSSLGNLNPFRYRGYVWDEETELYYLRSRYYDPDYKRFISADVLNEGSGNIVSYNVFAYCYNNPIMQTDDDGTFGKWFSAIVSIASAVIVAAAIVSAAPVIAAAAVTTTVSLGITAISTSTVASIATVGCATVAGATIACGVNRGIESVTGKNYGVELMGETGYTVFENTTAYLGAAVLMAPSYLPYPSTNKGNSPETLRQQMALNAAKQNPSSGKILTQVPMTDPRMPSWLGWRKYYIDYPKLVGPVNKEAGFQIHYVRNIITKTSFDFKIK